jgi:hypothetical protein
VRRRASSAACLALSVSLLVGCGGGSSSDNGVTSKSADQIVNAARTAADSASSVHVSGSIVTGGAPVTLDLTLAAGKGATGEISENGLKFKLIMTGNTVYISGSPEVYRRLGGAAAVQLLAGKWLKAPATGGEFASFGSLANMRTLIDSTLASHGTLAKGSTTTIAGQSAIAVTDTTKGGTLYVATKGQPYPLQIAKTGSESGKITFDRWNQPVTITPPANSVDLSELKKLG